MEIKFIESGSSDCPILLLFSKNPNDYLILIREIDTLLKNQNIRIDLMKSGILKDSVINLCFEVSKTDNGILSIDKTNFVCSLSIKKWKNMKEKLLNIDLCDKNVFQWLDESSDISLLISGNGKW